MSTATKITPKDVIAEHLFEHTTSEFPSALITEILERIEDERNHSGASEIKTIYDHNSRSIFEACGLDEKIFDAKMEKFSEYYASDACSKRSHTIEYLEKTFTTKELALYSVGLMKKIADMMLDTEKEDPISKLAKLLDKLKGGSDD